MFNTDPEIRIVYIFNEKDNVLRISENGVIKKGSWTHLPNNNIEIEIEDKSYLFRHVFIDEHLFVMKLDGVEEYLFFINDSFTLNKAITLESINRYIDGLQHSKIQNKKVPYFIGREKISVNENFNPKDFPELMECIESLKRVLKNYPNIDNTEIIISYCRDHAIHKKWFEANPVLSKDISNGDIDLSEVEFIFDLSPCDSRFRLEYEDFLKRALA